MRVGDGLALRLLQSGALKVPETQDIEIEGDGKWKTTQGA